MDMLDRLQILIKEAISELLNEDYRLEPNMVPKGIRDWAASVLGRKVRKYNLVQKGEHHIGMPVFEADRETYQMFKLENGDAVPMHGVSFYRSGNEGDGVPVLGHRIEGAVQIPSGHVLVRTSSYIGDVTLFTATDAQKLLPPPPSEGEQLSDMELLCLWQARSTASAYRYKRYKPEVFAKLISLGLMAANKAITVKGRNTLEYPEYKERLGSQGDKLLHLIEPWRAAWKNNITEAIGPEERKQVVDFAKALKRSIIAKYGVNVKVSVAKSVNPDPYIQVSSADYDSPLPAQLVKDCLLLKYGPEAAERGGTMGNITNHYIALNWSEWQKA